MIAAAIAPDASRLAASLLRPPNCEQRDRDAEQQDRRETSSRRRKRSRVSTSGRSSPRATAWASFIPRRASRRSTSVAATTATRSDDAAQIQSAVVVAASGIACTAAMAAKGSPRAVLLDALGHAARAAAARAAAARRAARARRRSRSARRSPARAIARRDRATTARTWTRAATPAGLADLRERCAEIVRAELRRRRRPARGADRGAAGGARVPRRSRTPRPRCAALRERGRAARRRLQLGRLAARAPGGDRAGAARRRRGRLGRDRRGQAGSARSSVTRSRSRAAPRPPGAARRRHARRRRRRARARPASGPCSSPARASEGPTTWRRSPRWPSCPAWSPRRVGRAGV